MEREKKSLSPQSKGSLAAVYRKTAKSTMNPLSQNLIIPQTADLGRNKHSSTGSDASAFKRSKKTMGEDDYIAAFLKQATIAPAPGEPKKYIYEGQMKNSKLHGYGRIVKRDFAMYEGQFSENKRDGFGIEIYANSDVYVGQYKADKKNGLGLYFFSVGGFYHGFFEAGQRCGFGIMKNKSGRLTYRGFWKKDQKSGRGKEFYKNGSRYDGFFDEDQRDGVGYMEYSKTLQYLGQWRKGMKHGIGLVDNNKSTVSGNFLNDEFQEQAFYNVNDHTELLSETPNYMSVEEYLRATSHAFKKTELQNVSQIYGLIAEPLVEYVMGLVGLSTIRLSCYQLVRSVFSSALRYEYFLDDIIVNVRFEPNLEKLKVYFEPLLQEVLNEKVVYDWNEIVVKQNSTTVVFDSASKGIETFDVQVELLDSTTRLVVTNQIVTGAKGELEIEGVLSDRGTNVRYFESGTSRWVKTAYLTVYPFFLLQEHDHLKTVLYTKCALWTGEFYFGKDQKNPLKLRMVLNNGDDGIWYNTGVDEVGAYVVAGRFDKLHMTGKLVQKYVQDYKIEYDMFLVSADKLQGNWSTTSLSGHFILRRDPSFKFTQELSRVFKDLSAKANSLDFSSYRGSEVLRPYFYQSILAVIIKGAQGGVPEVVSKRRNDKDDVELFERFKKLKEEEENNLNDSLRRASVTLGLNADGGRGKPTVGVKADSSELASPTRVKRATTRSAEKKSLQLRPSQAKQIEFEVQQPAEESRKEDVSMHNLRLLVNETMLGKEKERVAEDEDKSIAWIGQLETFGKKAVVMFDNMYIRSDMIEGVLTDLDKTVYELAGSYSGRTKEFEIVGMSKDKKRTLKIKGRVEGFALKGELSRRYEANAVSQIAIQFFGRQVKIRLRIKEENLNYENLPTCIKKTEQFIYGMVQLDNDLLFLNGVWNANVGYILEINSQNKRLLHTVLAMTKKISEERRAEEKTFTFANNAVEVTLEFEG